MQLNPRHLVGSNGRYYRLNHRDYLTYKIFSNVTLFFLVIFGVASIVIKTDQIGSVAVPHQLWFGLALCVAVVGYRGTKAIISRGVLTNDIDESDPDVRAKKQNNLAVQNTNNILQIIVGAFLIIFVSLGIAAEIKIHRTVNPAVFILLLLGLYGFIYAIVRRRRIRASLRAERASGRPVRRFALSWPLMVPFGILAFILLSTLYNFWIAPTQHETIAQQRCSLRDASTWAACADAR